MSQAYNTPFVNHTKVDRKGVPSFVRLTRVDRRYVRLATLEGIHRHQRSIPNLRKQRNHETSFLLTSTLNSTDASISEPLVTNGKPSQADRCRSTQRNTNVSETPAFDKLTFKTGSSLDYAVNTPQITRDLNFLWHILETNHDYAMLQAALQHDAFLYGLLAMTLVYQDSVRGEEASWRSVLYKNKAIQRLIPLLGQSAEPLMDFQVAAVAALATIDLLETRRSVEDGVAVVNAKGLRAALDVQQPASPFPRRILHQEQTKLDKAVEWLLLIFSALNLESSTTPSGDPKLIMPESELETTFLAEIKRILVDLSSVSSAADILHFDQHALRFSLGNLEATEGMSSQVRSIERSVVKLLSTVTSDENVDRMVEIIGFTTLLYISIFIRHVPRSAALNNALASKAMYSLRAVLSQNSDKQKYLLCLDGRLGLFIIALLGSYIKTAESQKPSIRSLWLHQWLQFFSLLCQKYNAYTSELLLSTVVDLTSPTRQACEDIKEVFEMYLSWQDFSGNQECSESK